MWDVNITENQKQLPVFSKRAILEWKTHLYGWLIPRRCLLDFPPH